MSFCLILLAGGNSTTRFISSISKPYQKIGGKTLLEINIKKATESRQIKKIVVVYNKKDTRSIKELKLKNVKLVKGGKNRQISTFNALKSIIKDKVTSKVLIHDAARPNFSMSLLNKIIKKMQKCKSSCSNFKYSGCN